jgi:hypothetical protein
MAISDLETEDIALLSSLAIAAAAVVIDEVYSSALFKALKIIGLILSIGLAIHRIRTSRPFYRDIAASDWVANGKGFEVTVPKKEHKRGRSPDTRCLVPNGHGGYGGCFVEGDVQTDGSIIVRVDQPAFVRLEVRK